MPERTATRRHRACLGALALCVLAVPVVGAGCGDTGEQTSLVSGKQMFIARCGSCHVLKRADTKGVVGPDLDQAFANGLTRGMSRDTVKGVVRDQIAHPRRGSAMPANLVQGQDAIDIAAYVADAADKAGKETGDLAAVSAGAASNKPAVAKNGVLEIPANPNGQLSYVFTKATAPPGKLTINSKNDSSVDHDIALMKPPVHGPIVKNGGVSTINVTLQAGTYEYYCTVPGHLQAGMKGTLTVK